ncbi:MAG: IS1182 family transposase [Planctomycetes bacterium]|nr:IS1182 family transposase [Planctomycetota bacterium]
MRRANRRQIEFRACAWNDLLPNDHEARIVWNFIEGLDVSPLLELIQSVVGEAGRSAIDPRILTTLWLYATLRGVGSARELDRRCGEQGEVPFQWICGGVSVNYHTLADFRTQHGEWLDSVLTRSVAALLEQELVEMDRVAQDGMRVRASAGASSFRRKPTLEDCLADAESQVKALKQELESDPAAASRREQSARKRAAEERRDRVKQALERMPEAEAKKKNDEKHKARVSTTDPEATVMKMPDGGFRPAFNVQFATDTKTQVITGVDVTNCGSDQGEMLPMVEQHQERYDKVPDEYLVDGGFAKKDDIERLDPDPDDDDASSGTTVYAPVQKPKKETRDPHQPRDGDSPPIAAWRMRMGTDEAKQIYKERAATAECVNAIARNRGLRQFNVRGLVKAKAVILWYVIAHNLMRAVALRAEREKVS